MHLTLWQRTLPRPLSPILLLTTAFLLTSCSKVPTSLKPGPRFVTAEEVPPHQGQVYIYWPVEEGSPGNSLMVGTCEEAIHWVEPGAYTRALVPPGRRCFGAEKAWEMSSINSITSIEMTSLDLDIAAGQTLFLRVEKRSLLPGMTLRSVEPAKAEAEIRRCGEMVPMSEEEMRQEWQARGSG